MTRIMISSVLIIIFIVTDPGSLHCVTKTVENCGNEQQCGDQLSVLKANFTTHFILKLRLQVESQDSVKLYNTRDLDLNFVGKVKYKIKIFFQYLKLLSTFIISIFLFTQWTWS